MSIIILKDGTHPVEHIKLKMADELGGLNSTGEISYSTYSELFDLSHQLIQEAYELGLNHSINPEEEL